jgi:hypothetical protein
VPTLAAVVVVGLAGERYSIRQYLTLISGRRLAGHTSSTRGVMVLACIIGTSCSLWEPTCCSTYKGFTVGEVVIPYLATWVEGTLF